MKVKCQKIVYLHYCYIALGSRSGSRSKVAVDIRGSALPSAGKHNNDHYKCKVIVRLCVCNQLAFADNHYHTDAVDWLFSL